MMFKTNNKGWIVAFTLTILFMVPSMQSYTQKSKKKSKTNKEFELSEKMLNMLQFRSIGPAAYSGRISDLAVNPDNPSEYYVGVAAGGLWKTINRRTTFKSIFDKEFEDYGGVLFNNSSFFCTFNSYDKRYKISSSYRWG